MRTLPADGKKGITVKVDEALHAEVRQALESQGMTMSEFVSLALKEWLHPKMQRKGETTMGNMRTLAFQVSEELFQKVKDYLQRNKMTQKDFVIGLIEAELERDLARRERMESPEEQESSVSEEEAEDVQAETGEASEYPTETAMEEGDSIEAESEQEELEGVPELSEEAVIEEETVSEASGCVEEEGEETEDEQEEMGLSMGM